MSQVEQSSCPEYRALSRRQFMLSTAAASATLLTGPSFPRVAFADSHNSHRDILVSIFLRGGCDGLSICVPHGDDAYYEARPALGVPRPDSGRPGAVTDLDGFFGLPPAMTPLLEAYRAKNLLFVQACGSKDETRSHFDAQFSMESGQAHGAIVKDGWIGRHLMSVQPHRKDALIRAIGVAPGLQQRLIGSPGALPIRDLADYRLYGDPDTERARLRILSDMYRDTATLLSAASVNTQRVLKLFDALDLQRYQPRGQAEYPETEFGHALKSSAALIRADVGVEALAIDMDGWDTHSDQGAVEGQMAELMENLAGSLSAFHADAMADSVTQVTVVIMSEFGRVVAENGSRGTDHGHGNVMILMGQGIAGGRVLHKWPGLQRDQLFQGQDLEVTIDYRDVLAEVLQKRLDNQALSKVFPHYRPLIHGVTA